MKSERARLTTYVRAHGNSLGALASTWTLVHERKEVFERLPNARWLSIAPDEVAKALALARILSCSVDPVVVHAANIDSALAAR